ncbi:ATP-binding protein [Actinomadura sp. KC216]|uniref:ATP-binding protein n=1 Tax=Actinomadura sp. KC216 TaxID=2530370 RepID=UPI001052668E|nr:ATP-binding protein [Actinomadura sp. KC216]TDB85445.1 ATP-binding protein [Actinomadura sp. KC216]
MRSTFSKLIEKGRPIMIDMGTEVGAISLKSSARAPEKARQWLGSVFRERKLGDDWIGRTVVTELVTNVYKHTDAELVFVRLLLGNSHLVLEVEDGSDGVPVVRDEDETAESGRGLLMMSLLVQDWGVRTLINGGKVTWARLGV